MRCHQESAWIRMESEDRRDKTYITGLCLWGVTDVRFTTSFNSDGGKKFRQSHRIYHAGRRQSASSTTANGAIFHVLSRRWWQCCSRRRKRWPLFLPSNQMTERVPVESDYFPVICARPPSRRCPRRFWYEETQAWPGITFNYVTSVLLWRHQMSNIWCQRHFCWLPIKLKKEWGFFFWSCAKTEAAYIFTGFVSRRGDLMSRQTKVIIHSVEFHILTAAREWHFLSLSVTVTWWRSHYPAERSLMFSQLWRGD